ncbi:A disintegrin and metalloproteinase with thrombospondin motifs like [Lineus longissimus]|uniref:A disintegrin and metalloproteinase with thrombospondin motifs like n=1 Tax=Lineus longissimus TaxID=88925 RepID=UPI00315D3899
MDEGVNAADTQLDIASKKESKLKMTRPLSILDINRIVFSRSDTRRTVIMEFLQSFLGLVLIAAVVAGSDPEIVTKRAVDVIDETKETTKRHPDELNLLLKDETGSDVRLRLRRGISPTLSVEKEDGVELVQLRDADEDAFYDVLNDQGVVMVRSVEQAPGVFKRSLSGSFLHDDKAYVVEAPEAHYSAKRDVATDQSKHNLIKRFDLSAEKASRAKRAFGSLGVEVHIIIDYTVYNEYYTNAMRNKNEALRNIQRYFAHVMSGVDIRYANLQESDFSIYIRVKGIHVIESSGESTFSMSSSLRNPGVNDQNLINADLSLNALRDWDKGNGRNFIGKSDHVMAFTMKDLYSVEDRQVKSGTVGIAFTKVMCSRDSYSVIEEAGVFSSEGTAAHELGHSLGAADHDGKKSASSCSQDSKYIMAPSNANVVDQYNYRNPYLFSSCSIRQFRDYFSTLGASNCMSNKASNSIPGWERPVGEMPGQILDAVAQCKGMQGDNSFPCPFNQKVADVCRGLSCTTNNDGSKCSTTSLAARGTSCGDKKWCDEATCVSNRYAPSLDETCPYGDFPAGFAGQQCASLIQGEPFRCYERDIRERCCGSCKKIKQNKRGCEYGDHQKFCTSLSGGHCSVAWNNWHCGCKKCAGAAISNCKDDPYITFDGKKCSAFVTSSNSKCYQDQVSDKCCGSCSKVVNKAEPGCLFGDNDGYTFTLGSRQFSCPDMRRDQSLKNDACTNHNSAALRCCETCRGF